MAELPPNSAPEDTQQSSAPNGWELVCVGILRSGFGRFRSHALDKAMMLLGMGRDQLRKIAVRGDFTLDLDYLEKRVSKDRRNGYVPICVVGAAGTPNTGAVDPLEALAEFCRAEGLWLHVDAAYGGPAA